MTEQKIVYYKGGNWDINKAGFTVCECGRRYYNSPLCKENHMKTRTHVNYLSLDDKSKSEIKCNERSIFWNDKNKNWRVNVIKDSCKYNKTFNNLQDAIKYRDEHSYIEERVEVHKPKTRIKSDMDELIELEKELEALINN